MILGEELNTIHHLQLGKKMEIPCPPRKLWFGKDHEDVV